MTQTSPAKVKVKEINQIGIAVWDVQKVAENYWNILGIGPWDIYEWEAPLTYDRTYHGKPSWAREKIALAQVGAVQLELCQPVDGDSVYHGFLTKHGEGLHHLNFAVDDVDETVEILAKEGFPSLQGGHFGPIEYKGAWNYIDTKPLRTIWEPAHKGKSMGAEPTRYPEKAQASPAKVKVKNIDLVAIVVKNVQKVIENYWNILGIGPWDIYSWEAPLVYDYRYYGKPAWSRAKVAVTQLGAVHLELIEPVDGENIHGDFLLEHGEGLHNLAFSAENLDDASRTAEILAKEGSPTLQSGRYGDNGAYYYVDIRPLRAIWELDCEPDNMGAEPTRYPQDSA